MVIINLLPWRERSRAYQMKVIKQIVLSAVFVSLLVVACVHVGLSRCERSLQIEIEQLKAEVYQLVNRQQLIQTTLTPLLSTNSMSALLNYRQSTRHVFAALGEKQADSVCFTEMTRNKNRISFMGRSRSPADLTYFLTHWNAAYLFSEIKVEQIERQADRFVRFHVIAKEKQSLPPLTENEGQKGYAI